MDLVTGGGGFIGSHLVDALVAQNRRVRVVDNFVVGRRTNLRQHEQNPAVEIIEANVADRPRMIEATSGVERIFHLAAMADIVPSVEDPVVYFNANVTGTLSMLEAARANGVLRFLYTASSSCYGIADQVPTPESAAKAPQYPYALMKYLGEQLVEHWAQLYGLSAVSVRLFNVYGPRARTNGSYGAVFGVFLAQLLAGKPLTIVGDGTQTRDFTYVSDVVAAILAVADSGHAGEAFNIGTSRPVSINRLVELLGASETVALPKRPGEPDVTHADTSRIRERVGWEARVSIEEGVAAMLDHIDYWKDAPVWTVDSIETATRAWFDNLSPRSGAGEEDRRAKA